MLRGLNSDMSRLGESYLFSEVAERVEKYRLEHPGVSLISLGIGDVTLPLPCTVVERLIRAAWELGTPEGFVGYGDARGDIELRRAICERYGRRGVHFNEREIFINDGAKGDLGDVCELLGVGGTTLVVDPTYPVYRDASIISHRGLCTVRATEENDYLPTPCGLEVEPMLIYLCSPANPTGAVLTREGLFEWIEFAKLSGSLIVFDAAYEAYITDPTLPHSIFELPEARECALEICSFSKYAGFTGLRCGWCAIPEDSPVNRMWHRRLGARRGGASHLAQQAAIAALSPKGEAECMERVAYYMENARLLRRALEPLDVSVCGGEHAPYLWVKQRGKSVSSWELFELLLHRGGVVTTPGVGFGEGGEGYIRLSSFARREDIIEGAHRIAEIL